MQRIFHSLVRDTQAVIRQCGYPYVYFGVACEVFDDAASDKPLWVETGEPSPASEADCARLCHGLRYDYLDAIDEFGYEAVYFGVGCVAFPEAVDPWEGNDY